MALNKSKGNMYEFVTHTWNTVKGACPHECSYCYMKRWGSQAGLRFDEKELTADLGVGNFIFVGSSCDMWAEDVPSAWIQKTLDRCRNSPGNRYLFQTKNPKRFTAFMPELIPAGSVLCVTIETNRHSHAIMGRSPDVNERAMAMLSLRQIQGGDQYRRFVTVEPILDFDMKPMVELIRLCAPEQVNIGSDSGHNLLPEPYQYQVKALISELIGFTRVVNKKNLDRIVHG